MRSKEGCSKAATDITHFDLSCLLSRHNDYVHKNMSGAYPTYTISDFIKGRKLQTIGGIASIYEILQLSNGDRIYDSRDDDEEEDESDMLEADYRYVLKTLRRGKSEIPDDDFQRNAYLEAETRILSNMSHPNIIRLEGATLDFESFIVLERLFDTLAERIEQWEVEDCKVGIAMFRKKKIDKLQETKLHVAYDIATAIEHLHKHNIIHRDIKPENFQFDRLDTIKLCNFSLARDLPVRSPGSSLRPGKSYRMTAMVGTPRYMAPEVGLGNKYNASCDVYSFAMTFAHLMSGEKPYENYPTVKLLKHRVWESSYPARPELNKSIITPALNIMLKKAWSKDILNRPKAGELKEFLWNAVKVKPFPKTSREWLPTDNDCPCCQRNSSLLVKGEIRIQDKSFEEEAAPFFVPSKDISFSGGGGKTMTSRPQWSTVRERWS